jgi:hypothetical protein
VVAAIPGAQATGAPPDPGVVDPPEPEEFDPPEPGEFDVPPEPGELEWPPEPEELEFPPEPGELELPPDPSEFPWMFPVQPAASVAATMMPLLQLYISLTSPVLVFRAQNQENGSFGGPLRLRSNADPRPSPSIQMEIPVSHDYPTIAMPFCNAEYLFLVVD